MSEKAAQEKQRLSLPDELCVPGRVSPVCYVDTTHLDLDDMADRAATRRIVHDALRRLWPGPVRGQVLLKVHTGERESQTSMRPEFAATTAAFAREKGASAVVSGDTTVAYTGPRGRRENPRNNADTYMQLAEERGWSADGPAEVPFVVLDRPCTALPGRFEFRRRQRELLLDGVEQFDDFWLAGGFAAADVVINHAHLTLHGLAGVAGCVKSLAMGCSALRGKLRMHQSLLPRFDEELCAACGLCVDNCPEDALELDEDDPAPTVVPDLCIGCGECEAVCSPIREAVSLESEKITDWERGRSTLPLRLVDYTLGLMQGRWQDTLHVLHMYDVTKRCDCLNVKQDPLIGRDPGFLIGTNPFAIDRLAGRMLAEILDEEGVEADRWMLQTAETSAEYAHETYGILPETELETISPSRGGGR